LPIRCCWGNTVANLVLLGRCGRGGNVFAAASAQPSMTTGLAVLAGVLVLASGLGLAWRRASGRVRSQAAGPRLSPAELGAPLGERATLVQFSSAFCAPCRATRAVLRDVAGLVDGVTHVEIDAESRLDLVRALDIRKTPTVLVLDPAGRVSKRASGQPRKADVIAALGEIESSTMSA
jgi:thiol-disulfide isomerase/thioredoxin